jgi:hypothetical protein
LNHNGRGTPAHGTPGISIFMPVPPACVSDTATLRDQTIEATCQPAGSDVEVQGSASTCYSTDAHLQGSTAASPPTMQGRVTSSAAMQPWSAGGQQSTLPHAEQHATGPYAMCQPMDDQTVAPDNSQQAGYAEPSDTLSVGVPGSAVQNAVTAHTSLLSSSCIPFVVVHTPQPDDVCRKASTAGRSHVNTDPWQEDAVGTLRRGGGSSPPSLLDIQQGVQRRMTGQSEQDFPQLLVLDGNNLV